MRPEPALAVFKAQRPRLTRLAYRMLGSLAEAEDVVQEAWLRWSRAEHDSIETPEAFLSRIVTRLCLDAMKSARARHETYVGGWLPEPLVTTGDEEDMAEDITLTLMLALERLSPLERAAFLLHDVFGVPLGDFARTLDRDAAAVRQLAGRARKHVQAERPRYPVPREEGERIARAFHAASASGDLDALRALLAEGVVIHSDGGGKVHAFRKPILGQSRVLRLYAGLFRKRLVAPESFIRAARIDGLSGYVSRERGDILQTTAFEIDDGRITAIYITRNPDKLHGVVATLNGENDPLLA